MYVDSAYIAKFYVNEPDSPAVRKVIQDATHLSSSGLAVVEVTCVFHRHVREGSLSRSQGRELMALFKSHVDADVWGLISITDSLLLRTTSLIRGLPSNVPLRAAGAIHLATALETGEVEVWTNDRHLLAAAIHIGLVGRSVKS